MISVIILGQCIIRWAGLPWRQNASFHSWRGSARNPMASALDVINLPGHTETDDDDNCIVPGFMGGDDVLLNGWMFCSEHSRELCHKCCRDHRLANNVQFEDELTEKQYELLTDDGAEDLADRKPLCARCLWQKIPGGKVACLSHSEVGCSKCFDFKSQVLSQVYIPDSADAPAAPAVAGTAAADSARDTAGGGNVASSSQQTAATAEVGPSRSNNVSNAPEHRESSSKTCWGCGVARGSDVKLRKCSECKRARYCSAECQRQHYPQHRPQCKLLREVRKA